MLSGIEYLGPGGRPVDEKLRSLLLPLQQPEAGDQPISVVCRIRDRVNAALARSGYVARAQIPPQELQDGKLALTVVAGRITEMRVIGNAGGYSELLDERLRRIQALDPFNKDEAVRILLLANDIPGLTVLLSLRNAGGEPGDLIGEVQVSTQPGKLLANVQNFGSRQLGREFATLYGEVYNITGLQDRTYIAWSNSIQWRETHIGQFGHDFGLNASGTRLALKASVAQSEPDIENLTLRSRTFIGTAEISHPLFRDVGTILRASGGFEVLNQATNIIASGTKVPFTHDNVRMLFATLDGSLSKIDALRRQVYFIDGHIEARKGIGILGATKTGEIKDGALPSRLEGDARATVLKGELQYGWAPAPGVLMIRGAAAGQWSNHPLLNLEEFSIGNFTHGRGYDPGANAGDRAVAFTIEPHLTFGAIGPVDIGVFGFYDYEHIWNLDSTAGTEDSRRFRSVGGGLQLGLSQGLSLSVAYAKPLDKALLSDPEKPTDRVLVSLTTKIWPWGRR